MKLLQKLVFWRSDAESEAPAPLPNSGPNEPDPFKINVHETPEEKEYREERQRELLEEHERRAEEGEPPDYEFK